MTLNSWIWTETVISRPGTGTNGNPGDQTVIGNSTPRYEYSFRLGADYKGLIFQSSSKASASVRFGVAVSWLFPDIMPKRVLFPKPSQPIIGQKSVRMHFIREHGIWVEAILVSVCRKQSRYLLDMSYLRIKNITLGYTFPENLLSKVYISKARLYMSLENFFTFDKLNGLPIDPEAISGYSMFRSDSNYNLGRTGMGTPVFKTLSCGVQLTF